MGVESRLSRFSSEPKSEGGQKSPIGERWKAFCRDAITPSSLIKPQGVTRKVWTRQTDIVKSHGLNDESCESIASRYGKSILWVNGEIRQGTKRIYNNSSDQVIINYPKETILPTQTRVLKERTQNQDRDIVSKLTDPNSDKEQLRQIKPKIGERFYSRHKGLFMRLPTLIKKSGLLPITPGDLAVAVLEQEGGVVVFSYHGNKERDGRVKTCHLVFIDDVDPSVDTLKSSERLKDYQDRY